jgi:hypothetical protein
MWGCSEFKSLEKVRESTDLFFVQLSYELRQRVSWREGYLEDFFHDVLL